MKLKRNVKIKKITKRMKVKKTLASSAAALVISGSLLPVGNVFAENQSTQENSISAAESKAKLENELSIPSLQNDEKKTQETQSSEIIDKNEKINIPEAAQEKSNNNENTELDSLNNNPILSNSVKTKLSDGRVSLDVSTIDQIQEAFNNSLIGQINFTKDFTLDRNIQMDSTKNANLVINGNGHTLDFTDKRFAASDSDKGLNLKIKDLNTKNSKSGTLRACFYAPFATVELENIDHEGTDLLAANKIRLSGKINCYANKETIDGWNTTITTWWGKWDPNCYVVVSSGADVMLEQHIEGSNNYNAAVLHTSNLILEDNSKCTVKTSDSNFQWGALCVAAPACTENILNIGNNAQLNVEYNAADGVGYGIDFWENPASLKISKTGELNVVSAGAGAILTRVANSVLDLSEGKFDIQATNGGLVNMMAGGRISFDTKNVYGWFKSFTTLPKPSISWENVDGDAQLSGWNTQKVSTTNEKFNNEFKTQNLGRISSEGSLIQELTKTTINEVKDTDTIVSGKGEPNASIIIKVGDQPIGNGTVDSEGNYSVPIQKQSAGTIIKAVVTKDGLSSEASTTVTKGSLIQTTISQIDTTMTSVSGKGEPNATIQLKVGDKVIAEGKVGSDGLYSLTIPKQTTGTVVKAIATLNGLTSTAETVVVRGELDQTTISAITTETTTVTGKGEPNATIQLKVGDKVITEGKVGSDGLYSLTIPKQSAGSVVVAVVTKDNKTSEASTVVKNTANATITKIDSYEEGKSNYVTGTYAGTGVAYIRVFVNGEKKALIPMTNQEAGTFKYYISGLKATDRVEVALYDGGYKELARKNVTVTAPVVLAPTTISNMDTQTTTVTGTGEPNATIQLKAGNKVIAEGTVGSDGKYSFTIEKQAEGTLVKAIVTKAGLTSEASTTVIKGSLVQTTISNIDTTMTSVSGKAEPNATIQLKVGNKVITEGKVGSDGLYSLTIPKQSAGTVVQAVATLGGLTSTAETVVVRGELDQTTISAITTETTTVTGTGEPNATIQLKVGDKVIAEGKVGSDGKYSFTIEKQPGGSVVVAVVTKDNKTSEASTVVKNTANATITKVDPYEEGKSNYVTGTYTGTGVSYIRVFVNGTKKTLIPMTGQEAGKFKYYINGLKATDKVEVSLYDSSYKELARKNVTVVAPSAVSITQVAPYKEGISQYVEGTYSGEGIAYIRVVVNGKNQALVPMTGQSQGAFKYYISNLKVTDDVKVQLYNRDYTLLAQKQVPIESTANVKITGVEKYIEGKSDYVRGTYDGEGAAYIRLVVNGVNKAMVPMVGQAQGTFSYYVQGLKTTDNVKVVLFDAQYRVLGEEKVIVEAPTVSNVTITSVGEYAEGKSEWITGSYEGDNVSYVGLIVNEKAEMRVPISDPVAKTFKYYKSGLKATDNVQVVLYNKKAEEVARKQLVITEPAVSNIKITSLSDYKVGKTEWITGSYEGEGASLVGLIIDGNEKDTVKVAISDPAAKTFRYYKRDLKPGQNVQVVLYGKDGKEVARKQLVIAP
ncbi:immunoglobulin-like domain-containing protein [Enterococcus faecalis]